MVWTRRQSNYTHLASFCGSSLIGTHAIAQRSCYMYSHTGFFWWRSSMDKSQHGLSCCNFPVCLADSRCVPLGSRTQMPEFTPTKSPGIIPSLRLCCFHLHAACSESYGGLVLLTRHVRQKLARRFANKDSSMYTSKAPSKS